MAVVQLFSNARSGSHDPRKIEALARAFEEQGARVLRGESTGGLPAIAAEATHVCIAGGDGTVRHVAGAVLRGESRPALSIYPAGTVNLLAMEAGYTRDMREFAQLVLSGRPPRAHYPVLTGEDCFFACAGVGPDSFAVAAVSEPLKRVIGRLAYAMAALKLLLCWKRHRIALLVGGREVPCEAFYLAKGRYYAGRWSLARDARLHEPVMHAVVLKTARRRDYLRFVATLALHRDPRKLANVTVFTCTDLQARAVEPERGALPVQADGDIIGALPARFTVSEAPLAFC